MNTPLSLFTDPAILARVQRPLLTRFLEDHQTSLPPDAAALLATSLNSLGFEEYCSAWATQFGSASQFGAPLLEALHAIEFLALPENASTLDETLSHLPPGCEINRGFSTLHQALHLWMLAHSPAGIVWPSQRGASEREECGANAAIPLSTLNTHLSTSGHQLSTPNNAPAAAVPLSTLKSQLAAAPISNLPSPISEPLAPDTGLSTLNTHLSTSGHQLSTPNAESADDAAQAVPLRRLKPWPDPISDAPALFDQVHDRALNYLFLPPGAAVVFSLWPGHAHCVKAFTHSPRLYVTSTEPGCGKTTALDFIACLCPDVLRTDNLKPAVLFRVTHKHEPTLILDEIDSYAHLYPDLRGLINAGHNLHGCATRCEGPNVRFFKAYAATAIAGIGDLPPTLAQRSIIIPLTKAPPGALQARFDRRHTKSETTLGRKIARWVADNYAAIAACDPVMPPEVINRLADNWRPLFAVAQVIGGHWPQRVVDAFNQLTARASAPAVKQAPLVLLPSGQPMPPKTAQLLEGIHHVFLQSGASSLFSIDLVRALSALPSLNGPRPLSVAALARQLLPLGVRPRQLRLNSIQARGYELADFAPLFASLFPTDLSLDSWSPDI